MREFLGSPVVRTLSFHWAQVRFPVRELRFHKLYGATPQKIHAHEYAVWTVPS